jgi:hypothetical protein
MQCHDVEEQSWSKVNTDSKTNSAKYSCMTLKSPFHHLHKEHPGLLWIWGKQSWSNVNMHQIQK